MPTVHCLINTNILRITFKNKQKQTKPKQTNKKTNPDFKKLTHPGMMQTSQDNFSQITDAARQTGWRMFVQYVFHITLTYS